MRNTDRRTFLNSLAAGAATLFVEGTGVAIGGPTTARPAPQLTTVTYKKVGGLEIKADVYRPAVQARCPVLLWIHGGALVVGNRKGIARQIREPFLADGYAIMSIDYRLAPETKLPEIIEDVRDAYSWLCDRGSVLFRLDTRRIAVAGGSAGGYLTLMTGFCVRPRPAVLVALWGYGDIAGDWYARPSEYYRKQPIVSEAEARRGVSGAPLADDGVRGRARGRFYLYCRQNGLWTKEVAGLDPRTQNAQLRPYCPVRNVTKDYPPTLLVHGTADTDVPYEQSVDMDRELARHGVEHRLISVDRAGHGIGDGKPAVVAQAYAEALSFVNKHVKQSSAT